VRGPAPRLLWLALLLWPGSLTAQSLRSAFTRLFIFGDCGIPLCLSGSDPVHANHFVALPDSNPVTVALLRGLRTSIVTSVSNIPASVASGGAAVTFVQGLPVTTPISAGPILGERASTLGWHRMLLGVNVTGGRFDRLHGMRLRNVRLHFAHSNVGAVELGDPDFENDIITVTPDFHLRLLATSVFATYGLTRTLDVGVVVPVIHASLAGRSIGTVTCSVPLTCLHQFGTTTAPQSADTTRVDASSTGFGDVTLRAKLALLTRGRWDFALLSETRLPTGREEDFMGDGHFGFRVQAIASATWGQFTGHLNGGYFARGGDQLNNAVLFTAGFDLLALPWLTLAGDVASQWQTGTVPFSYGSTVTYDLPTARSLRLTNVPDQRDDRLDGSLGVKLTNNRGLAGLANLYLPLRSAGLQAPIVWTVGAQYDF
jgi:hypothetical protein